MTRDSTSPSVQSVETTFRIVECIKRNGGARLTEIADQLGIHKSTVFKHLNTLRGIRYIYKDDQTYRLGIPFADLGTAITETLSYDKHLEAELDQLSARSEWVAGYAVKQQDFAFVVYLARNEAVDDVPVKRLQELHTSAPGKAILSQLPVEERNELIQNGRLVKNTEYTITDAQDLRQEIRRTSERGIAFDREEHQLGVRVVALPFEDETMQVPGAIFVAGASNQLTGRWFEEDIPGLISSSIRKLDQ